MRKVEFHENMITTTGKLTDKQYLKLKAEWYKRYTGKNYKPTPLEVFSIGEPIAPKGFLSRFFSRP
jgi:hypothetical protein